MVLDLDEIDTVPGLLQTFMQLSTEHAHVLLQLRGWRGDRGRDGRSQNELYVAVVEVDMQTVDLKIRSLRR